MKSANGGLFYTPLYILHTYYVGILLQRPSMYYYRSSGPKEPNEGAIRSGLPRREHNKGVAL